MITRHIVIIPNAMPADAKPVGCDAVFSLFLAEMDKHNPTIPKTMLMT